MGRPSGPKSRERQLTTNLRIELERQIELGQCAYCRAPARPDKPLTREHVIPRARGGGRKDVRIIVPACARCNHHRGCRDLIPFLLARPGRISSFLDYLASLSPECVRQLDTRVFAELYTAVAILNECAAHGARWRWERERLCSGRSLHRRRYAARRAVGAVSERIQVMSQHASLTQGPSCLVPRGAMPLPPLHLDEPLERMASRVLSLLALLWNVSAEIVEREMARELNGSAGGGDPLVEPRNLNAPDEQGVDGILPLDGWKARPKRKRGRVDRRTTRIQRQPGRAA